MALLDEGPNYVRELESLEQVAFDLQVKLYDAQLDVLNERDKMHRRELAVIKQQLRGELELRKSMFVGADSA